MVEGGEGCGDVGGYKTEAMIIFNDSRDYPPEPEEDRLEPDYDLIRKQKLEDELYDEEEPILRQIQDSQ